MPESLLYGIVVSAKSVYNALLQAERWLLYFLRSQEIYLKL
jgi:hypothetical protein